MCCTPVAAESASGRLRQELTKKLRTAARAGRRLELLESVGAEEVILHATSFRSGTSAPAEVKSAEG
jgi:hypothetical protein